MRHRGPSGGLCAFCGGNFATGTQVLTCTHNLFFPPSHLPEDTHAPSYGYAVRDRPRDTEPWCICPVVLEQVGALRRDCIQLSCRSRPIPPLNLTGSYTIEFWIRPERARGGSAETLVERRNGSAAEGYTIYLDSDGTIALRNNNLTYLVSTRPLTNGVWTHIAARYDSVLHVATIYVNGAFDTSSAATVPDPNPSADSVIVGTGFNGPFQGDLDNVRIWRGAQTSTEIRQYRFTALGTSSGVYADLDALSDIRG